MPELLELPKQIETWRQFFEMQPHYMTELHDQIRRGRFWINVEFPDLALQSPELADMLLEQPEEILKAGQVAIDKMDLPAPSEDEMEPVDIRVFGLPSEQSVMVRDIRSKHLNKLLQISGLVRQKSDVRPQVTTAKFECPSCGNILPVLQLDSKFKEPSRCGCGRKGKFKLLNKQLVDAQSITLEEAPEELEGGEQPKRMKMLLKRDLVRPMTDKKTNPGSKILVVGVVKEVPIVLRTGGKSTRYDLIIEVNSIEMVQEDFTQIELDPEDEKAITELSQDPDLFEKFVASVAPSIYGHEFIKQALLLQLFGGVHKRRDKGVKSRGDIHVLLIGDPGAAKSQMLRRIASIAPKARYVAGMGASGRGLTASVVKDEFLRGWALEAGALVLANKGLVCIDELDKMSQEDTSAMHEALEQQCYHPSTEFMTADGQVRKMGAFVDTLLAQRKDAVVRRGECELVDVDDIRVLTMDSGKVRPTTIEKVSRRPAPSNLVRLQYANGRELLVTPEHPVFVWKDGALAEVPAGEVTPDMLAPAPRQLPIEEREPSFAVPGGNSRMKPVSFPAGMTAGLSRLLGYVASEGHSCHSGKNRYAEIGISNTDEGIARECERLFTEVFDTKTSMNVQEAGTRPGATKTLLTVRCPSLRMREFFALNFKELLAKAPAKRIGNIVRSATSEHQIAFLQTAFKGDGFIDSERFGYSTSSYALAKDYQDILLRNDIYSYIARERRGRHTYYKVVVTEPESMRRFLRDIVEEDDGRRERIRQFVERAFTRNNHKDPLPCSVAQDAYALLKELRIADGRLLNNINKGHNVHVETLRPYVKEIRAKINDAKALLDGADLKRLRRTAGMTAKEFGSASTIYYRERTANPVYASELRKRAREKIERLDAECSRVERLLDSDIRFTRIVDVETVENTETRWVYDITVGPTKNFISEGLILHNSVSIAKANIQATLRCETTVLAAANPKFGRFDPYEIISKQIDLPPTLINRFDLIFPVRDIPDRSKDEKLATFILDLHKSGEGKEGMIDPQLIRKYIAYSRQRVNPTLSDTAIKEIKQYFVKMRGGEDATDEQTINPIPISARQLEALIRLAEASARLRLSKTVTKRDAQISIELVHYCLNQIGMDPETGKLDLDRITTGISASQRSHISMVKEIIRTLEKQVGKSIPLDDIIREAGIKGIDENTAHDVVEKLKRAGDVYSPKSGYISRL